MFFFFWGAKIEPFCGHHKKEFSKNPKTNAFLRNYSDNYFLNEITHHWFFLTF
jgi:hypothetical protein